MAVNIQQGGRNMNRQIDFDIVAIQHVIERMPNPNWKMEKALNPDLYIIGVALDGCAEYMINGQTYMVKKGGLVLLPPGAVRAARSLPDDPWHFITIGCQLRFPDPETSAAFRELPAYFQQVPDGLLRKCGELVYVWNGRHRNGILLAKSVVFGLYYDLLQYWESQQFNPAHYNRIMKAQEYIHHNYSRQLQQKELAELCGYSESHFRQLFHTITGMSCSQYIISVKISVAKNLLLSGTANVSEAAELTGFSDIYYFSRVFKKITGYPPSHYKV